MASKILILIAVIVVTFLLWGVLAFFASDQFGKVGAGGAFLAGFAALPVIIRLTIVKLFKPSRRLDD